MREGWKEGTIGDVVAEMKNGVNCKQNKDGDGDIISRIETISNQVFDFNRVGYSTLSYNEKQKYRLGRGDILFSHINSPVHVGKSAILDTEKEIYHGVNLMLMRVNEFMLPKYFHFFLIRLFQSGYWRSICKQSVNQASVNQKDIKKIPFAYPPIHEQKRIVAILDEAFEGIDAAIANTQKNLASARELFYSYLNSLSYEKNQLGKFVTIRTGKLNANAAVEDGDYPFFTCSRETYRIDNYAFDCEAILLAGNNASGDFNVKHYNGKFNAYQRTYVIEINNTKELNYRFLYFELTKALKALKEGSVGVGTKFLKIAMITDLLISFPTISVQEDIVSVLDSLAEETQSLETLYQQKLDSLNALKQSLLAKAFSGELTAQPEQTLKEAVG